LKEEIIRVLQFDFEFRESTKSAQLINESKRNGYSTILANTRQICVLLYVISQNVLFHLVRLGKVRQLTLSAFFGECL
jgi:hypothetical protein